MDIPALLEAMGDSTYTASEFHALLPSRMQPTAKANLTKQLQLAGHITVGFTRDENGKLRSEVRRA